MDLWEGWVARREADSESTGLAIPGVTNACLNEYAKHGQRPAWHAPRPSHTTRQDLNNDDFLIHFETQLAITVYLGNPQSVINEYLLYGSRHQ